jgi:hypothetical protein
MALDHLPLTFPKWLGQERRRLWPMVVFAAGLPAVITPILRNIPLPGYWPDSRWHNLISLACNLVALLVILAFAWQDPFTSRSKEPQASEVVLNFHACWCLFWLSLLVMYMVLIAQELMTQLNGASEVSVGMEVLTLAANFAGNLANLFLLLCFLVLARRNSDPRRLQWVAWCAVLVVVTLAEVIFVMVSSGANSRLPPPPVASPARFMIDLVYSFAGAISLALLIGRLESKFILAPLWVVGVLYCYAIIQVVFPICDHVPKWFKDVDSPTRLSLIEHTLRSLETGLYGAAAVLKVVLFLFVSWMLQTGVLLYYVCGVHSLEDEVIRERREFINRLRDPS